MPLPAAMALSGLSQSHFGSDLQPLYDQGAQLLQPLNQSFPPISKKSGVTSGNKNMSADGRSNSDESGIASVGSGVSDTYWDFLDTVDNTQFNGLGRPNPTNSTPKADKRKHPVWPPVEAAANPAPSGVAVWPPVEASASSAPSVAPTLPAPPRITNPEPSIMYQGRDVLDLGTHLRDPGTWNFRPARKFNYSAYN